MNAMRGLKAALLGTGLLIAAPALADVEAGVDAWSRGDWQAAIAEWQGPAARGDADAQFNLAQAYRLGRGVTADKARAEDLYRKAAAQGHIEAADTYGLLLFQDGRREMALPYVTKAAERGDPRAQYLLGIAHFNGDLVPTDWVRAYALLTLANSAGLAQASGAIAQMDQHIPMEQRQQAAGLALQMRQQADSLRTRQLAATELATGVPVATQAAPIRTPAIAPPVQTAPARPSVGQARAAVAQAARVTGSESPAEAGADFASSQPNRQPAARPTPAQSQIAIAPSQRTAPVPTRAVTPAATSLGPWKIQLGAFGVKGNAERLWSRLSSRSELSGKRRLLVPAGRVTKLLAGGYASRNAAQSACNSLKRSGQDCLVTK